MNMKLMMMVLVVAAVCLAVPAFAKRSAPEQVKPVEKDGIEYSAPADRMGFVVATWALTKQEIWRAWR
ncbi:MAG: hypothetical protein A2X48_06015 [Lentisphaerae bacterium GWF2_49_21]|nr:MAG: hypothetical protein A2X48_06015 [Lentisphaerae bacterium GWF2_49_21]